MSFSIGVYLERLLSIGWIAGTGIFSTPEKNTAGVASVGAALTLWGLGLSLSFAELCVWLEYGCMFPKNWWREGLLGGCV